MLVSGHEAIKMVPLASFFILVTTQKKIIPLIFPFLLIDDDLFDLKKDYDTEKQEKKSA